MRGFPMAGTHKILILGGGFGGLVAAQTLKRANASVTLIDKRNFHLFQPLLYQVATSQLARKSHKEYQRIIERSGKRPFSRA